MSRGLIILAYHRVLEVADPLRAGDIPVDCFESQMRTLERFFNVLPLQEAVTRMIEGSLPGRAVSITFDDGYADNYQIAWPILRRLNLPATIFVATGYLNGGRMWNDTVIEAVRRMPGDVLDLEKLGLGRHDVSNDSLRAGTADRILQKIKYAESGSRESIANDLAAHADSPLPANLMLTSDQVVELCRSGIEIGAHTVTHPILKETNDQEAAREIRDGKMSLEEITGQSIRSFAYPNGKPGIDYDSGHVELVRAAEFSCAVSTSVGVARKSDDLLQLPRFGPWAESSLRFGLRLMRMYLQ